MDIFKFAEENKHNRDILSILKSGLTLNKHYELLAEIVKIEKETLPDHPEIAEAQIIEIGLRLVGLDCNIHTVVILNKFFKIWATKKGKFDLKDAVALQEEVKEIFK